MRQIENPTVHLLTTMVLAISIALIGFLLVGEFTEEDSAEAQPGSHFYILYGYVFDPFGDKVPNATVDIKNPNTTEVIKDKADENGDYSNNLANFQEGWEDGQRVIVTARYSINSSTEIFPNEDDGGGWANVTLPAVSIISPNESEELLEKSNTINVEVEYFPSINASHFIFYIDSVEYENSTSPNFTMNLKELKGGIHVLRVKLMEPGGDFYADEITFTVVKEKEDEDSNTLMIVIVAVVAVIVIIAVVYYHQTMGSGTEQDDSKTKGKKKGGKERKLERIREG